MKGGTWLKLLASIFITAALLFFGFIGVIISAFMGGVKFYTPLIVAITIVFIVTVILAIFNIVRSRRLTIWLASFLVVCGVATAGYEINKHYHRSIPTMNDQGVSLYDYQPFASQTKAVSLDKPASLNIQSNLPRMDGATALYPLYAAFAQSTYPEKEYHPYDSEVMSNNTVYAYKNLINGDADIIFVAGPSKQQLDEAERKGVELKLTPIGREAFVFFVNAKNPVHELSLAQIQDIYAGKITNWHVLGGNHVRIRAFQRPENSGSQTALQKLMEGKELMVPPKEDVVAGMGGIISETASYRNYKNAIGYSFLFFATEMIRENEIKLIAVNGVPPDKNTIKSNEYPLAAEFYAVTAGSENPHLDALINWILSAEGQDLVEKTGYTPINAQ